MQPGTSAKSHWINYILLWKNEIYSGKHLEKSWKNDPERLCEPCTKWFFEMKIRPPHLALCPKWFFEIKIRPPHLALCPK